MATQKIFFDENRSYLKDLIPLDSPFSMNVEVSSYCNIQCKYCSHSVSHNSGKNMSIEQFDTLLSQIARFPKKLKKLVINGVGEPLCNPDFPLILKKAVQSHVADKVEFFTNATLLTDDLSRKIIESGVDRIKISLQGLTSSKYYEICNRNIDFEKLYQNIQYLNSLKQGTEIFIKIINIALDSSNNRKEDFFSLFSFTDRLAIENVQPWFKNVSYDYISDTHNKYGVCVPQILVCPVPFYRLYIDVLGNAHFCYSIRKPTVVQNCFETDLINIWNGEVRTNFLKNMLFHGRSFFEECKTCTQ